MVTDRFHSPQEMENAFLKDEVDMAVVFGERFADGLYTGDARLQLVMDATDPNMSTSRANYATGIVSAVGQEMLPANVSMSRLTPDIKLLYNPQMKSAYNFVPGVMGLILMLICAMMTSISIVREKETGTMEVLLVSPVKPLFIILAKAVPYFVLSFVNLITILLLSIFVLDVPIVGSVFWLVMVSLLFIFVSLALGLLISSVTRTQVAAMLASGLILMMPTMILSGMIFPIESMPLVLRLISDVLPARWYIQAVRKLMIEGVPVVLVYKEISILLLMPWALNLEIKNIQLNIVDNDHSVLVMSGFGLVISNYSATMQQSMFVMWFCMLIFILMSGLFTPISSMPEWAQLITYLNPLKYLMEVMRMVYLKGSGFVDLLPQLGVLLFFAVVFNSWAVVSYRKNQ